MTESGRRHWAPETDGYRCGGRFELIATFTDPRVARRILQHLKLPALPPAQAPPRDPPPFWPSVA